MEPQIKIRGYHTDLYQHVNNARYLEFLEEGRWQLLEDHLNLEELMKNGVQFFVVNINISYKTAARVNDVILVHSGLKKIGKTSAVIKQQIVNKKTNAVCIDADITFVIADSQGKPQRLDGLLKKTIEAIPYF